MLFPYSCFISYRHTKGYKGRGYVEKLVEELKEELELRVEQEVYLDKERLRGAEFYQEALATAICRSACLVMLYWPTYLSESHPFCAREFKAMEALEERRLPMLAEEERMKGLIVVIALRGFRGIPKEIMEKRKCWDFSSYTLKRGFSDDLQFNSDILDISRYIAGRCRALSLLGLDREGECAHFNLPTEQDVMPWIRSVANPGIAFAHRSS